MKMQTYSTGALLLERLVATHKWIILKVVDDPSTYKRGLQVARIWYDPFHVYGGVSNTAVSDNGMWTYEVITEYEAMMLKLEGV